MQLAETILNQMKDIRKSRVKFTAILFKTVLSLMERVNLSQFSRYSSLNEKTYSRNFRRSFDFVHLNSLSTECVYNPKNDYLLAIDASFIPQSGIVYSVFLKRRIHLVYVVYADTEGKQSSTLLFSTDVTLYARTIYHYHTARFQIEFVFRDAKQFPSLTHCRARTKENLVFHFNMSLSLLNLARIEHQMKYPSDNEGFSMTSLKRSYTNELLLNLFLSKLELYLNNEKIQSVYQGLRNYGTIAA